MKTIRLHPGKERSLRRHHPWVFDSAIASGGADSGETVRIEASSGEFLAWAAYSGQSRYRARVWSFEQGQRIDAAFFRQRIDLALQARARLKIPSNALRLIQGESDDLPGLIVDRYADTLVAQFLSAGAERWKSVLCDSLRQATGLSRLYERSDTSARGLEGLPLASGWLGADGRHETDAASAEAAATEIDIEENGCKYRVDIARGHKTGFYLDQRENRRRFAELVATRGLRRILNCYCYSGGFSVAALCAHAQQDLGAKGSAVAGLELLMIDSSAPALQQARLNVELNGQDGAACTFLDADVNRQLRSLLAEGRRFDAIVLDPPKLAPSAAHAERAARAYKDINRLALMLLDPGGLLMTFSCSGAIDAGLFHKIVASAGADAGVDAYILERLGSAPDHAMTLNYPEGEYLKGLLLVRK